jgi:hypothetical protein
MDTTTADAKARDAFRAMLRAYFATGSWDTPETRAYLDAETDASFVTAQTELEAVMDADYWAGGHFAGMA